MFGAKRGVKKRHPSMWAMWNKAMVVNSWRAKVDDSIIENRPLCHCKAKIVVHRFWDYSCAQCVW